MNIERYFDVIYNALSIALLVALAVAIVRGCLLGRRIFPAVDRLHGRGAALAAFGTALALAGGLLADSFLKDTDWFQHVRFGTYFVGFALFVLGTTWILRSALGERPGFRRMLSATLAALFVASLAVSIPYLIIPSTFVLNSNREQVQLVVYWLPTLVSTGGGAVLLVVAALKSAAPARAVWVAVFETLLFLGLLREAEIVPDLGDPLLNLLISFVPFLFGGIAVAIGAGMRRFAVTANGGFTP